MRSGREHCGSRVAVEQGRDDKDDKDDKEDEEDEEERRRRRTRQEAGGGN